VDQGGGAALGARILTVGEMFALGRFVPASVQRDFQWEERQCQELFSDLERVFAESEAARADEGDAAADESADATIDLLPERGASGGGQGDFSPGARVSRPTGDGGCGFFDGLQRLTSLTILFCVLRALETTQAEALHAMIARADGEFHL